MRDTPKLIPEFEVSDLDKTKQIYIDIFGFDVGYERPEEKFAYMQRGSIHIMLEEATGPGRRFHNVSLEYPFGRGLNFQIEIDDVEAVYQRVQESDLKINLPLEEKWYRKDKNEVGNQQFVVFDPDGYLLRFFTDLGERAVK